ncbi:MAG: phosphomannomutase/phosphoglucomutase [Acidobacteriota bacterium]|nr:phosphomannomutase/phosphoglucomutase [Acidobacteriota bacterium]
MNQHIFREYDIRGIVSEDLNEETVSILARAIGTYFRRNKAQRISLGRDARASGAVFRDLMIRGLNESGCDVLDLGKIPTPLAYFSLFTESVDAGVMITGSHNPANYNGFKLCLGKSTLHGAQIQEIKRIALAEDFETGNGTAEEKNIVPNYLNFVAENIQLGKRKLKVVVDAGNGIGGIVGAPLFKQLGCETVELFIEPDSRFPNHHPDPTVPENLEDAIKTVREQKADLAICFDGDGDRIGIVDERGNIIWGDELMIIFARSILQQTPEATFIAEVKCSERLFKDIEKRGGRAIMWKAGHSLIKAKMRETGAALAGEMSGHIFFADRYFGYDDAIYSGARLLEILSNSEEPLSEFLADLPSAINTPEIRVDCPEEMKFEVVRRVTEEFKKTNEVIDVDGARIIFENGWGLVRASNTQAILVLRFEATDQNALEQIQSAVENKLKEITSKI